MDEFTLPNLHAESVEISSDLNAESPFEALLNKSFDCEYTKKYLKGLNNESFIESALENWTFEVDKKLSLSQSKIKSFWSMVNGGSCPETFKESLTNRKVSTMKESVAMIHGQLFEYLATGQKNYTNQIPDESVMYLKNENLSKVGEIIKYHADLWKKFVRKSGFKKIQTGLNLKYSCDKYIITSLPDVVCEKKRTVIIDLKLGDSEGTFGDFSWNDEKLPTKDKLLLQAKVNKFIWYKNTGEDAPFIFYIANKANENAKAREIEFKSFEDMIIETEKIISDTYKGIKFLIDFDLFNLTPEVKFCSFCKVENCFLKTDIPIVKTLKV